jgi:tRNA nucleotidyltransferase (CCA-adding enzyme)
MNIKLPFIFSVIGDIISANGGQAFLVGGAVRDKFLGLDSKDFDIEVFGMTLDELEVILKKLAPVKRVGVSFAVLKLFINDKCFDFSLPRRDVKTGLGHRGFDCQVNPNMTFKEAACRRDFTMNAMGIDISNNRHCLNDPFNGLNDLNNKMLRVVDPDTFVEDPLRVLRGAQFAARFNLKIDGDETIRAFRRLVPNLAELARERIFDEVKKLLLKAEKPSIGLKILRYIKALELIFPNLTSIVDSRWEYSGNFDDKMTVVDYAAQQRSGNDFDDLVLMLSAIYWPSYDDRLLLYLGYLTNETKLINSILSLAEQYQQMLSEYTSRTGLTCGSIRRLSVNADIDLLIKLTRINYKTCNASAPDPEILEEKRDWANFAGGCKIERSLMGRDLIKLGHHPGPNIGKIINKAFEIQLDTGIDDKDELYELAVARLS